MQLTNVNAMTSKYFVVLLSARGYWLEMPREERQRFIDNSVTPELQKIYSRAEDGILVSVPVDYESATMLIFRLGNVTEDEFQKAFRRTQLSRYFIPHWDWDYPALNDQAAYDVLVNLPFETSD